MTVFRPLAWTLRNSTRRLLVALAAAATLLWAFVELADEVSEGEAQPFDVYVLGLLVDPADASARIGPAWLEGVARDVSALGSTAVLAFLVLATTGFLWLRGAHRTAGFVVLSVLAGTLLNVGLKMGFDRARPDILPRAAEVYTASFPSGHSLMAALVYLTLGAILARAMERRIIKGYVMILAICVVFSVGLSRVYLGVHWPTDVLAGWSLGAFWALFCATLAAWLARRGALEPEQTRNSP